MGNEDNAGLPLLGVAMLSSAIGISFVMSIPNHNFGGIGGDVVGAMEVIARLGALLLVAAAMAM